MPDERTDVDRTIYFPWSLIPQKVMELFGQLAEKKYTIHYAMTVSGSIADHHANAVRHGEASPGVTDEIEKMSCEGRFENQFENQCAMVPFRLFHDEKRLVNAHKEFGGLEFLIMPDQVSPAREMLMLDIDYEVRLYFSRNA